jgi:hypothetical protein
MKVAIERIRTANRPLPSQRHNPRAQRASRGEVDGRGSDGRDDLLCRARIQAVR